MKIRRPQDPNSPSEQARDDGMGDLRDVHFWLFISSSSFMVVHTVCSHRLFTPIVHTSRSHPLFTPGVHTFYWQLQLHRLSTLKVTLRVEFTRNGAAWTKEFVSPVIACMHHR
jgi:hypothetical protein